MTSSWSKPWNNALEHHVQEPLRSLSDPLWLTLVVAHESPMEDAREDTFMCPTT